MSFHDPEFLDPKITPYSKCPFCKKLIRVTIQGEALFFEERICPHCQIFIEEEEIINGFIKNFSLTQSCTSANKISSFDVAVIFFLGVNFLLFWMDFPIWFRILCILPYFSPLIICLQWFRRHYWYDHFLDPEYSIAVKEMKKSLSLWIFANILCGILLFL